MSNFRNIDTHKLMYHPKHVLDVVNAHTWKSGKSVYPVYVEVSPVGNCNHRCTFCAVDYLEYAVRSLDFASYQNSIYSMGRNGVKSVMFAGEGEPLLHKRINDMVLVTKQNNIDVAVTTNGVAMTEDFIIRSLQHLSWIKVSFNAGTPETYAKVHGTKERDFHKVVDNLKMAVKYKKINKLSVDIGLQAVLLPENADEMVTLVKLAKRIGVDYVVIKPYSQHNSSITTMYKDFDPTMHSSLEKKLSRYNTDKFHVVFRSETIAELSTETQYQHCYSTPMSWAYIMSTGDVYACSAYLGNDKFNLGNINNEGFVDIWESNKRKDLFESYIDISECRKNCRMNACNKYLDDIINDKVKNVNFV